MKDFFKNFFKQKRNIVAVVGIVVSIIICAVTAPFSGSGSIAEVSAWEAFARIVSLVALSCIFSFILLIFNGKVGFWLTLGGFSIYILIVTLNEFSTKTSTSILLSILSFLLLFGLFFCFIIEYKLNKQAINNFKPSNKKEELKQLQVKEAIKQMEEWDKKFKEEIKYLDKSIIISSYMGGLYQIIKCEFGYYFHRLGFILNSKSQNLIVKDFDNFPIEESLEKYQKDFFINFSSIHEIIANIANENVQKNQQLYGKLIIKSDKKQTFSLVNLIEEDELKQFFGENIVVNPPTQAKQTQPQDVQELTPERKAKMNKLNIAYLVYTLLSSLLSVVNMFFLTEAINPYISTLVLISLLLPFIAYLVFRDYFHFLGETHTGNIKGNKISLLRPVMVFPALMALKALVLSEEILSYDYLKLFLISLGVAVVLFLILLLFTKERKKNKLNLIMMAIAVMLFAPVTIIKINSAYDFSKPQEIVCQVAEKPTHTNNNNEVTYYLKVTYNGKKHETEVEKELYDKYQVGDDIVVVKYYGALSINKVILKDLI